jgi:hypothetical protein
MPRSRQARTRRNNAAVSRRDSIAVQPQQLPRACQPAPDAWHDLHKAYNDMQNSLVGLEVCQQRLDSFDHFVASHVPRLSKKDIREHRYHLRMLTSFYTNLLATSSTIVMLGALKHSIVVHRPTGHTVNFIGNFLAAFQQHRLEEIAESRIKDMWTM